MNFAMVGAVFAFLSVAFGAFGAHALKSRLTKEMLVIYEKGVLYQMYHALALVAAGIILRMGIGAHLMQIAGWLFVFGIVLFSGSLYLLSLSGKKVLGAITPFGGLCFLSGWVLFILGVA